MEIFPLAPILSSVPTRVTDHRFLLLFCVNLWKYCKESAWISFDFSFISLFRFFFVFFPSAPCIYLSSFLYCQSLSQSISSMFSSLFGISRRSKLVPLFHTDGWTLSYCQFLLLLFLFLLSCVFSRCPWHTHTHIHIQYLLLVLFVSSERETMMVPFDSRDDLCFLLFCFSQKKNFTE